MRAHFKPKHIKTSFGEAQWVQWTVCFWIKPRAEVAEACSLQASSNTDPIHKPLQTETASKLTTLSLVAYISPMFQNTDSLGTIFKRITWEFLMPRDFLDRECRDF